MNDKTSALLSCWPDGYSRYYVISNVLRLVYGHEDTVKILDVGGDSKWMAQFLDDVKLKYQLNIVDTRKPDFINKDKRISYTQADFFNLNTTDYSADAVINTDVLEHIPSELKVPFINRCIDFAESLIIFSAPQDDEEVTSAEKLIDSYYKKATGKQQKWLKEHFEFGKPNPEEVESAITAKGLPYITLNSNSLGNWFMSFSLNYVNTQINTIDGMDEINRFYNESIHTIGDFSGKPYRKIYIVFKDLNLFKKHQQSISSFFEPNNTTKDAYLVKVTDALVSKMSQMKVHNERTLQKIEQESILLDQNLKQTQEAFVLAKNELDMATAELREIKASKVYRYGNSLRNVVIKNK